ncbi:MAG: hypothetical protein ABSG69_18390 [Candidatus Acidiferrum sp.]|jgi:hypothetical protein
MHKFSANTFIAVLLIGVASALSAAPVQQDAIGFVAVRKGQWMRVQDKKILDPYDEIFPNTTLRTEPSTSNSIKIAFFLGSVWSKGCTEKEPCGSGSIGIPAPDAGGGVLGFLKSFFPAEKHWSTRFAGSRGIESGGPKDAILVIDSGTVNVAPALEGLPTGTLRVTLTADSATDDTGTTATIHWPQEVSTKFGALPPGIYSLDVLSATDDPLGSSAAVLLVLPAAQPAAQADFKQAQTLAAHWEGIDSATRRGFLVRALYAIDLELKK